MLVFRYLKGIKVGVAGFEPTTSTSQMWRDTGLRYTPNWCFLFNIFSKYGLQYFAESGGFEPPVQFNPYDSLANCWFQPLTQLSEYFKAWKISYTDLLPAFSKQSETFCFKAMQI